ncbi:MAG: GTP pyrophosphokinase family protein [Clostridia bacterium]|nr:GTP pyrophosphokinase family protein [Clostridia bacterium]
MENKSIYGDSLPELQKACDELSEHISEIRERIKNQIGMDPVEHYLTRIKSEESMREKCVRKGLPVTTDSALNIIKDAIGVRIVCAFVDDVYDIKNYLKNSGRYEFIEEKDYIRHAKPNGYRSYHIIIRIDGRFYAEIQLRTISMDTWAALEHHLKYKKNIGGNTDLIVNELKRCADELASTDLSLQTIRDMIIEEN